MLLHVRGPEFLLGSCKGQQARRGLERSLQRILIVLLVTLGCEVACFSSGLCLSIRATHQKTTPARELLPICVSVQSESGGRRKTN